jgi:predicted TIM-barrel fold metal-dependent hydrolase
MEGKIAVEEHFSTELTNSYWDAKGEAGRNGANYAADVERRLLDLDATVAEMDRAGVEVSVMSLTSPGVQSVVDRQRAIELARSANDFAATLARRHPGRLSAFASVPLQDPAAAAVELRRAVGELGLKGALVNGYTNLGPGEQVQYLDAEPVREFWSAVSELNVPVYLHPREPLPSQMRSIAGYPELGGSAWAFGYETASHAIRLMLSGLFDQFPNVQVILGHLGEGLPYLLPRLQHRLDEQRAGDAGRKCVRRPGYYFGNNFYISTSGHHHTAQLEHAISQVGADRVLFAADYPYEQMDAAGRWFDECRLPEQVKAKIGRDNANDLFRLGLGQLLPAAVLGSAA